MTESLEFVASGADAQRAKAAYERARAAVLTMTGDSGTVAPSHPRTGTSADPSVYWQEELGTIDYMIEASPLILRKLRHHAFHITGIRPYDYRSKGDTRRAHFEARLQALREMAGDSLLVPESPALGGFGYDIGGRLFNVDTLKFFEVLIGMERGGVLAAVRDRERPVVCEIGAGWGGFAYQFKTLFPRSTLRHRGLSRALPVLGDLSRHGVSRCAHRVCRRGRIAGRVPATRTSSSCRTRSPAATRSDHRICSSTWCRFRR